MNTKITWMIMLVPGVLAQAHSAPAEYMMGALRRVRSRDHYSTCSFSVNGRSSPSEVRDPAVCEFLLQAYRHNAPVCVQVKSTSSSSGRIIYDYSVSFLHRNARWARKKLTPQSLKYQLTGSVEDVYYKAPGALCYVAVRTGQRVSNDGAFHVTADRGLCDRAVRAFYLGQKVMMLASVDVAHNAVIDNLIILE